MKGKIIGIIVIVAIIAVLLVAVAFLGVGASEYFEDDFEEVNIGGTWGQEIILEYADGSTEAIKPLYDSSIMSVLHSGKEIYGMQYAMNTKASGTGYASVLVDFSEYDLTIKLKSGSSVVNSEVFALKSLTGGTTATVGLDGNWHKIGIVTVPLLTDIPGCVTYGVSPGTYTLEIVPGGSLRYKPSGESSFTSADLPSSLSFTVEIESDNSLSIVFSHGYVTY